jgi:predicted amidohydrolase
MLAARPLPFRGPGRHDWTVAATTIAAASAAFVRNPRACLARLSVLIGRARAVGADLLVLPECALGGYLREPLPGDEPGLDLPPGLAPDGPEIAAVARMAGDMVVCVGYTESSAAGLHSSAVCVSGDGVLGHQRKVHLPPSERFAFSAGDGFAAFDTPAGRIGMLICYDKLFPEAARALALDGAGIVCCLAAWPADRTHPARRVRDDRQTRHFDLCDELRAVENQVVLVSANQSGRWGPLRFLGGAKVVDPDGIVRARTGVRGGLAVATLDVPAELAAIRARIDHLADRRPDAYGPAAGAATALNG